MRLYEYEGKRLFAEFDIPVPEGLAADNPQAAFDHAAGFGRPVILKAQVLTGGRGKAGGVKAADTPDQAQVLAEEIFRLKISSHPVKRLLVEPKIDIVKEYYLGVTIDRVNHCLVIIGSSAGGVDIEETAENNPQAIIKLALDINEPLYGFDAFKLAKLIGFEPAQLRTAQEIIQSLLRFFRAYDAKMAEINPLVESADGSLMAANARVLLDEDALFRHPELAEMSIEKRHAEGELTPREKQAADWGIPYLDLDGNIGMLPGGAGFGIMSNDFINYFGGKPANFMDSGGELTEERIARMLVLLDDNPQVSAIFATHFGGTSGCDDFARGVVKFIKEHGLSKPMVMHLSGLKWTEGVGILEEERKANPELFRHIQVHGAETLIEEIAKKAVVLAQKDGGHAHLDLEVM